MPYCLLDDLGALRFGGADARKFLQGQLSNDLQQLSSDTLLRAGLHNPQGRTLALLTLADNVDGDLLALLPQELLPLVAALLKRYVLRAKVTIVDDSQRFRIYGLMGADQSAPYGRQLRRYGIGEDMRQILLQDASDAPIAATAIARTHWRALDIAAGLAQVSSAISGQFVAQMLNLDCVGAISFSKGCYTGQEIIARAHYRGHVKRRMQRFVTTTAQSLKPGDSGQLADGRNFRVVDAVRQDGRCEFLAVAPLDTTTAAEESQPDDRQGVTAATALPLPYTWPEDSQR
jgi:folate-binding protein YgfZ